MTYYISDKNDFGKKEIRPIKNSDLKKYKRNKYSQPMPGDSPDKIIDWVSGLLRESYDYKKQFHHKWFENALDYYQLPSFDDAQRGGRNPDVDVDQDTEIMVPALIKRYVNLGAFWLSQEIFKSEPFMQFTSYSQEPEVKKAQKLYERKLQGDAETYSARAKATEIGIDLFLYGNAVAKVDFTQERMITLTPPEIDIEFNEGFGDDPDQYLLSDYDEEQRDAFEINVEDPEPMLHIIDQYSEFRPIFLGHFFIDPVAPRRDWRKATYMGDVEYVSAEEIMERYGHITGFASKFESLEGNEGFSINNIPMIGATDSFLKSYCNINSDTRASSSSDKREIHSVIHFYTKYTETCIIDGKIVVYHKYRSNNVKNAGPFPYIMFRMPTASGTLYSVGYGHILRTLQLEQIILASKRLQTVEDMNTPLIQYLSGTVDEDKIKHMQGMKFIEVEQPGAISEFVPNHGSIDYFLNAESRNFERAREYAGIPGILDSSNTKTHLGAVSQRMEASQVQFNVILDTVRDGFKEIFQKIHSFNMAYLEGDVPIKGSTGPFNKDYDDNVLTEQELMILANEPELAIQLNLGRDIGDEKIKAFAAVVNTQPVAGILQQLQTSGALSLEKQMELLGILFNYSGLNEFTHIFEVDQEALAQQQAMMQQQQMAQQGQDQQGPPQQGMM